MIQIHNLNKSFKDNIVFVNADLELSDTGFYVLYGPNGSGKSTLFEILSGDDTHYQGSYLFNNQDVKKEKNFHLKHVAIVYQDSFLLDGHTVLENLLFPFHSQDIEKATEVLKQVNLLDLKDEEVDTLSMGERQRLMIAIAIFENKEILLFDEPISSLDDENAKDIIQLAKTLSDNRLVIFATHDDLHELGFSNFNTITIEDGALVLQEEHHSTNQSLKSEVHEISTDSLIKNIFRNNKAISISFSLIIILLTTLCSLSFNMTYGLKERRDLSINMILENYEVYNFNLISDKANPYYDKNHIDLKTKTEEIGYQSFSSNIFINDETNSSLYRENVIFYLDSDQYELVEGIGKKTLEKRYDDIIELSMSDIIYEKILQEGFDTYIEGEPVHFTPGNLDDLNQFLEEQSWSYTIANVYQSKEFDWDYYQFSGNDMLSYMTTGYIATKRERPYESPSCYKTKGLTKNDLKGYAISQELTRVPREGIAYDDIKNITIVLTPTLGIIALLILLALNNTFSFHEKYSLSYLRLLGVSRKKIISAYFFISLSLALSSMLCSLITIPISVAIYNSIMLEFYPYINSLVHFNILSLLPNVVVFICSFIFLLLRNKRLISKDVSKIYHKQKEEL